MKHYRAYGLNISSEVPCPELQPGITLPDVTIRYASLSPTLPDAGATGACFQAAPGRLLLKCPGATYLVSEGSRMVVDPVPQAAENVVRVFLLESAFGALLLQRGILPLHGSAVKTKRGAAIFVGPSGSGKSTLAAALRKRDYLVLADEICAVSPDENGRPAVVPAYPQLRLWADVVQTLGEDMNELTPVRDRLQKFTLRLGRTFCDRGMPLACIYALAAVNEDNCYIVPMQGTEKLEHILANTYQRGFLKGLGVLAEHFRMCARVAKFTPMRRAFHPNSLNRLDEFVDLVEKDLLK